jgi:hypothetical protein
VRSRFGFSRPDSQRLADLRSQTAELERRLSDARLSLEREFAQSAWAGQQAAGQGQEAHRCVLEEAGREHHVGRVPALHAVPRPSPAYDGADFDDDAYLADDRTEVLVNHGRRSARSRTVTLNLTRGHVVAAAAAAAVVVVVVVTAMLLSGQASWPSSVATVRGQADQACQNPDVKSEPGQVNFACAEATRQILWVFALLTSGNDANFADAKTGRVGLEPIAPTQGGEIAWSLNLHHPYDPSNPIDSLAVAARAINNIIGGATVTSGDGKPIIQSGLESNPANCLRYTGSAAVTARKGFPRLCARPVASPTGQAALVGDVYQKWVVGSAPSAARDAAVLFANADDPGNPQVQAILRRLSTSKPLT